MALSALAVARLPRRFNSAGRGIDWQRHEFLPAKALVAAVLERAFDDLRLGRHLASRAREWFADREAAHAWSFEWCCAILDLDPDAVRAQLPDHALPSASACGAEPVSR